MTNKTPFELRFDALQEATSILTQEYYAKYDRVKQIFNTDNTNTNNLQKKLEEIVFPSTKTIMDLAETYNKFVSGK